jgi:hypothetical protein
MARFQGNVHSGSDRAGATLLMVAVVLALLMIAWWYVSPETFNDVLNVSVPPPPR